MASGHDFMVEVLFLAGLAGGETGLPGISRMDSGPRPPWAFPRIRSRSRGSAKVFLALRNLHRSSLGGPWRQGALSETHDQGIPPEIGWQAVQCYDKSDSSKQSVVTRL